MTDLDEDGLKFLLKNLPSWVKVRSNDYNMLFLITVFLSTLY